jgi:hypothetical protein
MNFLFKKWINYFSEKNSTLEFLFFIFLLVIWGLNFIPIYKSGFIYWNYFDLLSKLCEQQAHAVKCHKNLLLSNYGRERPNIQFDNKLIDFGNITNDINSKTEFRFKNLENKPVVINKVLASCGCTSTRRTKPPVLPNKHGKITVGIDTNGFNGFFSKSIAVKFDKCDEPLKGTIKGNVKVQI